MPRGDRAWASGRREDLCDECEGTLAADRGSLRLTGRLLSNYTLKCAFVCSPTDEGEEGEDRGREENEEKRT